MNIAATACAELPTEHGTFALESFRESSLGEPHLALTMGLERAQCPLVRIHSECITGDAFGSLKCDCGQQLDQALQRIGRLGCGVVLYLRQEGRGIGIEEKIRAYALQQQGLDTVDANLALGQPVDSRAYDAAVAWLIRRGVRECVLLTNNPDKVNALQTAGIDVRRSALKGTGQQHSEAYLEAKRSRMGHDC